MTKIDLKTSKKVELIDVTSRIQDAIGKTGIADGICMIYVPHTTAGTMINENADPSVMEDIVTALDRLVPESTSYRHMEGNSPAHIKVSLTGSSSLIPVEGGRLKLGRWQGVFFCEFDGPRRRELWIKMVENK